MLRQYLSLVRDGRTRRYVAYGDRLANENPMFYCSNCYDMLHYDTDGQLLYDDFTVYDYDPA